MQLLDVKAVENEASLSPSPSNSPEQNDIIDEVDANEAYYANDIYHPDSQHQQEFYSTQHHFNKRQTGKKNISNFSVGLGDKIEFDQIEDKGFGVVKINRPIGITSRSNTQEHLNDNESTCSHDSERTHTADGHFDLKFYSHPLW